MTGAKIRTEGALGQRPTLIATGWLLACLALGGASNGGVPGNLCLQIVAALVVGWAIARRNGVVGAPGERVLLLLLGGLTMWIALTLVPLPPAVWSALPGRGFVAQGYRLMGMDLPWLPISLTDDRTVRSSLALLVPVASYLLMRKLDAAGLKRLAQIVIAFACVSVALGMAQLLGGDGSPLRPYAITNRNDPVGLFANANHFATFLLVCIPLAGAISGSGRSGGKMSRNARLQRYFGYGAIAICALGLVLIGSNAGRLLLIPALAGALLLGPGRKLMEYRGFGLVFGLGIAATAAVMVLSVTSGFMADKVGASATSRTLISGTTLASAREFLPAGSGLGSFPAIYLMKSGGQSSNRQWTNHAHDDPAEVLLELGLPGLVLMAGFALWLVRTTLRLWSEPSRGGQGSQLAQAAALGAALIALHSLVDYPLRTAAMAAILALLLGCMIEPQRDSRAEAAA